MKGNCKLQIANCKLQIEEASGGVDPRRQHPWGKPSSATSAVDNLPLAIDNLQFAISDRGDGFGGI